MQPAGLPELMPKLVLATAASLPLPLASASCSVAVVDALGLASMASRPLIPASTQLFSRSLFPNSCAPRIGEVLRPSRCRFPNTLAEYMPHSLLRSGLAAT